ncbi:hypothetical protein [Vibrio cortegadensis]|uniref:hypothetical protein n=1 Tax=Vibrio cortegadensis TaxID=1328770 RepID=UPI00352C9093
MNIIDRYCVKMVSSGSMHHFFGFHDLPITNKDNTKLLSLQVDDINHPPEVGQYATYGYIDLKTNEFIALGKTNAWNYPQGARQQWIGDSNLFVVNNQVDDCWGAFIVDSGSGEVIKKINQPVHIYDDISGYAYTMNYSRLHRMGGYGYVGLKDDSINEVFPKNDGIFKHHLETGQSQLLVSIYDVAYYGLQGNKPANTFHHILTHLSLNPSKTRLAFLHRYRIPDGGEITRLMTIGVDGTGLRCLSSGFLSHFDWFDDDSILIWGRKNESLDKIRSNPILANPLVKPFLRIAKSLAKQVISTKSSLVSSSFLKITDCDSPVSTQYSPDLLKVDGHPMFNPCNRRWFVNDTYPDENGVRTLMLFDTFLSKKIELGQFKMLDALPDQTNIDNQIEGIDERVMKLFSKDLYSFTRSGIHCDLHPRWFNDGKTVAFDSIHEGMRQVYTIDVSDKIS